MKKKLRKITPFLILIILSVSWAIYILMTEMGGQQWEFLLVLALFGVSIILLISDLILKRYVKQWKKVLIIELIVVFIFFGFYQYQNRPLIFQMPENFSQEYVTVIYNVDSEKKLGINKFTLRKKIQVPENGIILTSSDISENLPRTEFKSASGEFYNSNNSQKIFIKLSNSQFEQNGLQYDLRTWRLGEGGLMISMKNDFEEYKTELKTALEKKASR